jgi:16S rRNA (adenine1518-N6/adenine1519-N6)-dimethyltransferase
MTERRTSAALGPTEVRRLCAQLGLSPSKRRGQNFVHDANTVRRIVAAARLSPTDVVLEVGPGLGSLTLPLLDTVRAVAAVEIEPVLARALPTTVSQLAGDDARDRLVVIAGDALRLSAQSLHQAGADQPTALVANLPYNVSVPVLLHVLHALPSVDHALVMVQAEVADRLTAGPGSRTYGAPSAKVAWYARAEPAGTVPRSVFWPVPNVDSSLVRLTRVAPPATAVPREQVFAVIEAAFAQRRKGLRAALAGWAGSPAAAERYLRAADVDPTLRGERLSVSDFARIAAERPGV